MFIVKKKGAVMDLKDVQPYIEDKVCMVTGGGGSIGSEIVRSLSKLNAEKIVIVDIYENGAYSVKCEVGDKVTVEIASVRDYEKMDCIMNKYRPDIVFHAAAHKHVPFMELSPEEAVKNNVKGTETVADLAEKYNADNFVLISTDKAVRPTNIMGASKRLCELVVQSFAQNSKTEYAAVRFGNVLGSNGSVIPLFKKQIAEGGPVTVTHPDIIRYFMTIPEAVNLVLQCGALARKGEIFILDMGKPVKILELARKMIRLSGYMPDEDIKIEFTGLRPGEKLYEELLIDEENLKETANKRIFVVQQKKVDSEKMQKRIRALIENAFEETKDIRREVQELVPEYVIKGQESL